MADSLPFTAQLAALQAEALKSAAEATSDEERERKVNLFKVLVEAEKTCSKPNALNLS